MCWSIDGVAVAERSALPLRRISGFTSEKCGRGGEVLLKDGVRELEAGVLAVTRLLLTVAFG